PWWTSCAVTAPPPSSSTRPVCCPPSAPRSWWPICPSSSASALVTWWPSRTSPTRPTTWGRASSERRHCRWTWRPWPLTATPPCQPSGEVLDAAQLAAIVTWARERGIIVASDECYALLPWTVSEVPSVLDPRVSGGELEGLLCVYSLSKQSNLAGYRAAFVAGDPALVGELLAVRKQAGMMLPGPIQTAMTVALGDDDAAAGQREIYRSRREVLEPALRAAGGEVHGSQAGLYLWTTFGEKALTTVDRLAG